MWRREVFQGGLCYFLLKFRLEFYDFAWGLLEFSLKNWLTEDTEESLTSIEYKIDSDMKKD